MSKFKMPKIGGGGGGGGSSEPPRDFERGSFDERRDGSSSPLRLIPIVLAALLAIGIIYAGYFWFIRRIVVGPGEVLVLMKKNGTRSLPDDQVVIPRPPDQ